MINNSKTAAELMSELSGDPEYLERIKVRDEERQKIMEQQKLEERPVVDALRSEGVIVDSISELIESLNADEKSTSVLLKQLDCNYPDHVREAILRAMSTPSARMHWDELVDIFEHNTKNLSSEIRYVAALTLSAVADDAVLEDVIRLIGEERLGRDRVPLLLALIRSKSSKAKMMLLELRSDPDLGKEIKKMRRLERHQKAGK